MSWIALLVTLLLNNAWACQGEGRLQGQGMLTFGPFNIKIYQISHYVSDGGNASLALQYQKNIAAPYSRMGWEQGLKKNLSEAAYQSEYAAAFSWILENTPDMRKGDCFIIAKKNDEVTFEHNQQIMAQTRNALVRQIVFYPWLGEQSVDDELKNSLLGIK